MVNGQLGVVLRQLHRVIGPGRLEELNDGQLLERFVAGKEEAAFAALVRRHGPMVFGVCRRVLHNRHDAEDAFQATFVVLVRRAPALDRSGSLANWLYTVAYHAALKARAAARRRREERHIVDIPDIDSTCAAVWGDLRPVLDAELSALPRSIGRPSSSATSKARPTRMPCACSAGRPAPSSAGWRGRGRCCASS